jgi:SAM-dependent methyltransferase
VACDCCESDGWRELFEENGIRLGQCPDCDLLSIADIAHRSTRMTEIEAGHYAGGLRVLTATKQLESERVLRAEFQQYVDLAQKFAPNGRWLDIGCGAGFLLSLANQAGYVGEGIELTAARRAVAQTVTGMTVHGRPIEELALPGGSFDVVSLINVFSHLTAPSETLAEIRRVLRPGGVLVLATGEMAAGVRKSHMMNWNLGDHLHFLGERTMGRYADSLGFRIDHHERNWLPDRLASTDWLRARGRSVPKNMIKSAILHTPGAFAVFRSVMLRRQRDSAAYSSVFVLTRTEET